MSDPYEELRQHADADSRWTAIRSAAGAEEGTSTITITRNSISSSLLPMLDRHLQAAPRSVGVGTESVAVQRLDRLLLQHLEGARRPY